MKNTIKATELCPKVPFDEWNKQYPIVDNEYVWIYPLIRDAQFDHANLLSNNNLPIINFETSVYIHVPACLFHCPMCFFYHEILSSKEELSWYADSLIKEIELYSNSDFYKNITLKTIYFGGGTATLLSPKAIGKIINTLIAKTNTPNYPEITVEGHPLTVNYDYLKELKEVGVNRVSFGIQSFNDSNLKLLGLKQTSEANIKVLTDCAKVGFNSVAIDLLYRIPNQDLNDIDIQLKKAFDLGIKSISTYSLGLSPRQEKLVKFQPSEEIDKEMFYFINSKMQERGWTHVAQPDYAAPGFEHKELLVSWKAPQGQNLSLGAGAFSVFNNNVYCNVHSLKEYKRVTDNNCLPIFAGQQMDLEDCISRYPVLGTRCFTILNKPFLDLYGYNLTDKYKTVIEKLINQGLIEINNQDIIITKEGKYYIDNISKSFYSEKNICHLQPWGGTVAGAVAEKYYSPSTKSYIS